MIVWSIAAQLSLASKVWISHPELNRFCWVFGYFYFDNEPPFRTLTKNATWHGTSFFHIIYLRPSFLSPSRNSDPGSHSRLFDPLPTTVRALHFYRQIIPLCRPSSTRVELWLPTLLGALSGWSSLILLFIFGVKFEIWPRTARFEFQGTTAATSI